MRNAISYVAHACRITASITPRRPTRVKDHLGGRHPPGQPESFAPKVHGRSARGNALGLRAEQDLRRPERAMPFALRADKHFLQVECEEAEPETVEERAWLRLKGRREFEREQQAAPPPEQSEEYAIIEWDKEKCWW